MRKINIIVADDDKAIRVVLDTALKRSGYEVTMAENAAGLWKLVQENYADLIITDVVMPDENAFDLIPKIKKINPNLPIIVMSAQNTLMTAITANELGAFDYLPKPFDIKELLSIVNRAISEKNKFIDKPNLDKNEDIFPLIGRSKPMQEIYRVMARLMHSDLTVLITGESGTGKELIAKALHEFGDRKDATFVPINMAAIPRELIESELFGHEKGSFTGAISRKVGKFQIADGGTLFLDEIGDMPIDAQTRLLRVLQEGEFLTVGGISPIKTNIRIIAATNKSLQDQIKIGAFREDLYYRINVIPIKLPPLRDRNEDIPALVNHFISKNSKEINNIDQDALMYLKDYIWPGNIRELENFIKRIVTLYPNESISLELVKEELSGLNNTLVADGASLRSLSDYIEKYLSQFTLDELIANQDDLYQRVLVEFEKPILNYVMKRTNNNQIKAAKILGLNRNTLRKKLRSLNMDLSKL
ncbi:MAG: nitrogen regulation protein NR(I) [Hyphomicrobiales bacterium]|jgi:two-component system, NtrC family, nitrogen regulation response regulator GlnG|nr:nitrogen regulation protein NR(I) [Hyphomicrobiales bacterium]|tara:strand:- start:1236 stop:2657 length:1422 start_codon:yes stop_codon:yes gene_type:complete